MKILGMDFETANSQRNSACSVGLYLKEFGADNEISSEEILINPQCEFDGMNISIHGIRESDVADADLFPAVYARICSLIDADTYIIAHNAAFDIDVLAKTCAVNELPCPDVKYLCTFILSKALYPQLERHKLDFLVKHFGLGSFEHHNALEDAQKAVELFEKMFELSGCDTLDSFLSSCGASVGRLTADELNKFGAHIDKPERASKDYTEKDYTGLCDEHIRGKSFVFTGTMSGYVRDELSVLVEQLGGVCKPGVTKKVDYLVVGVIGASAGKQKKAAELIAAGVPIKIISESNFYDMLAGKAKEE